MIERYVTPCSLAILMLGVAVGDISTASAQDADRQAQLAEFEERLEETRARLNLTDPQVEQITPILRSQFEAQMEVLQEHGVAVGDIGAGAAEGGRRLGLLALLRLGRDLDEVRERTLDQLREVLTDEQIEIYREIEEENREAMRERMRERG